MDRPGVRQSQRSVENREKWRKLVAKSSVVPQRPSRLRDWCWWWDSLNRVDDVDIMRSFTPITDGKTRHGRLQTKSLLAIVVIRPANSHYANVWHRIATLRLRTLNVHELTSLFFPRKFTEQIKYEHKVVLWFYWVKIAILGILNADHSKINGNKMVTV